MGTIDARNQKTNAITDALNSGALTVDEMHIRLSAMIDAEMEKPPEEIDTELVGACEELLHELYGQEAKQLPSHKAQNYKAVKARLAKSGTRSFFSSNVVRVCTAAAAVLILLVLGDGILRRQWLNTSHSDDEQQFIIEGKNVNPGLIDEGVADQGTDFRTIETPSWEEVVAFLGYGPAMPAWIPEGWAIMTYVADQFEDWQKFAAFYQKDGEEYFLIYEIAKYTNPTFAREEYEQDGVGRYTQSQRGHSVYLTTNIESTLAVWIEGLQLSSVSGPISESAIMSIIESIPEKE